MTAAGNHHADASRTRTPFVGREREQATLREAWDEATAGRRQLVLLSGEPGIGKTRLASEFAAFARAGGALVLRGQCDDEALFAYQPFVEALRQCLHTSPDEFLAPEASPFAPALVRLLPELRVHWPRVPEETSDPETERYHLFEAVASCVEAIAERRSLLLILEDLQWSDQATLLLLRHVVRSRPGVRCLLLGSYRDTDLARTDPLSGMLADLRRDHAFRRISLNGLAEREVATLVEGWAREAAPEPFVQALHAETEGNPFFVEEVLAHLSETGGSDSAPWSGRETAGDFGIPEGVREVIGRRLSRLSAATNQMLASAAVLGHEFDFSVLQRMAELDEETVLASIDEALRSRTVVEQGRATHPHYAFSHALVRQTLYEELSLPRRQRLHLRAAHAIEVVHGGSLATHLPALAIHYRNAGALADREQVIEYCRRAAEEAIGLLAWGEAAAHYEGALEVLELGGDDEPVRHCALVLALGSALLQQGETGRVLDSIAPRALALAEQADDPVRARAACQLAMEALTRRGQRMMTLTSAWRRWADAYDRCAGADTADRVRLDIDLGWALHMAGREDEARAIRVQALERAKRLGQPEELISAASVCISFTQAPMHERDRLELTREAAEWPADRVPTRILATFYLYLGWAYWDWGERPKAEAAWRRLHELPARSREAHVRLYSLFAEGTAHALDGRLEEAVEAGRAMVALGDEIGSPVFGRMLAPLISFRSLVHLGRPEEALKLIQDDWRYAGVEEEPATVQPRRAVALAHLGQTNEASALLDETMEQRGIGATEDGRVPTTELLLLLEAAVLLGHVERAAMLAGRLAGLADLVKVHGGTQLSVARQLGAASVLMGEHDAARVHYERALRVSRKIGFRPELALAHLDLAELLLDRAPDARSEATEHLEIALRELARMRMEPALERAERVRSRQGAAAERRPDGLTGREVEVLRLIADGKRNQEIADELVISQHTVNHHVRNILSRIGASNRAEAASYAHRQGLVE